MKYMTHVAAITKTTAVNLKPAASEGLRAGSMMQRTCRHEPLGSV